ncbi:MAG: ABC transporter ATP-binding protein [Candidatus Bathyarchaeia archaeon]
MPRPIIEVKNVKFTYPSGPTALDNVSFTVSRGEKVAILGPNGSGKSTLILLLTGLLTPQQGEIMVFEAKTTAHDFKKIRHKIGLVFQDPDDQLFTSSVIEDVEYGPKNLRFPEEQIKQQSNKVLSKIGIENLKDRAPHRLSFGEKKKVALATALVLNPELLILDEPTANLDLKSRRELISMLKELNHEGTTIVVSTHDIEALPELVDRIILISHGSKVGEGETAKILQDIELLTNSGLEPPATVKLFSSLKAAGFVTDIPVTLDDAIQAMHEIVKKK